MNEIVRLIETFTNWLWGPPLLILVVGGGILLTVRLGFFQIRYFPYIMKQTFGKIFSKAEGEGTLTPFQAATAALASSIGAANIVVVPSIIFVAGPGAVFWMWVTAVLGQATKFSEIVLGLKYREKNAEGEYVGGPAYYMKKGVKGTIGKILGFCVSFFFMIEILPSITLQTLSAASPLETLGVDKKIAVGLILALVLLVVYGGISRIGKVTEKLVPFMALVYFVLALIVILANITQLPNVFYMIFVGAFNPKAVATGIVGATVAKAIQNGVARGVYSNEAGMGSAPYAHSTAVTDHPCRQGMWGIFEVFVDTIIVCSMSAMVVLSTGTWTPETTPDSEFKAVAVAKAVSGIFGNVGSAIVSVCLFLFVLSTIIVIVFYCEKQAEYLFGSTLGKIMRFAATAMVAVALFISFDNAGVFLDFTLGLVVVPNMIALIFLSGEVVKLKEEFFNTPGKYYLKDIDKNAGKK